MTRSDPALRVVHLTHRFGTAEVLHDMSLEVARADVFGLIGPTGAGKTTLLRILATLMEPTEGRIVVGATDAGLEPERARQKIGFVSDHAGVYPKLTVEEYLRFFSAAFGRTVHSSLDATLDLAGLSLARDELCGQLSSPMRLRLQIARELLHEPRCLLLDDPTSHIDSAGHADVYDVVRRLRQAECTMVIASRVAPRELSQFFTKSASLDKGRISGLVVAATSSPGEPAREAPRQQQQAVRTFKLRTLGGADAARAVLAAMAPIEVIRVNGDELIFRTHEGDAALADAVFRLTARGIGVIGLERERVAREPAEVALLEGSKV